MECKPISSLERGADVEGGFFGIEAAGDKVDSFVRKSCIAMSLLVILQDDTFYSRELSADVQPE
jgi:hypothetical protein